MSSPASLLANYAYTPGAAGNRLAVTELGGRLVNYGYDNDYRLTSEAITSDAAGNNGQQRHTQLYVRGWGGEPHADDFNRERARNRDDVVLL